MFKRILTADKNLQLVQDNIDQAITPLQGTPFSSGVLVKDAMILSGQDNIIVHGLNRVPQNWLFLNLTINTVIWSPSTALLNNTNINNTQINLRASTSCVADVWVS